MERFFKKRRFGKSSLNISRIIALVFFIIILLGTVLLSLPFASRSGQSCGVLTAAFTATSATCVTGLIMADTWLQWSAFGQIVIITLIEIGGLGFMSAASFVIFVFRRRITMNARAAIAVSVGSDDMNDVVRIQKKMLLYGVGVQVLGALVLTLRFARDFKFSKALRLGFFHAISAFCNAGFDILGFIEPGASVAPYGTDTVVVLVLSFLIAFGGLGFLVWDEIICLKSPKKWSVYTKLVMLTTAALLAGGSLMIYAAEWNNPATLGSMPFWGKIKAGFFQSVTTRTAGFAGIDQGALTDAGKAITIFLMLIGGSSGSTAGGLKTVTFIVLVLFLWSRLRGKENIHVFYRRIPEEHVLNALTVFGFMVFLSFFGGAFLSAASGVSFTDGLYESVSAIATVGLTTGITPTLSVASKLLMMLYMYFGRVGILTVSLGFLQNEKVKGHFKYADTGLLIG